MGAVYLEAYMHRLAIARPVDEAVGLHVITSPTCVLVPTVTGTVDPYHEQ